jgi:hypothetical protein
VPHQFSGTARRVLAVAALALPAVVLGACSDPDATPAATPTPATSTLAAQPGHVYEVTHDLCEHVSLDAVLTVLPNVDEDLYMAEQLPGPLFETRTECDAVLGTDEVPDLGVLGVSLFVFDDEELAKANHDGVVEGYSGTAITGLGQEAVGYVDEYGDAKVAVLDGNALIDCSWVTYDGEEPPAAESLLPALEQTCRDTVASLRSA